MVIPPFSKHLVNDGNLKLSNPNYHSDLIEATKFTLTESERLKQDPYPSDFLLVNFASVVYNCGNHNKEASTSLELPEGWSLLTSAKNTQWLNKYYGAAFVNYQVQQVVISHRGTDVSKFGCLWTDVKGVYGQKTVGQMSSAATFADIIRSSLKYLNEIMGTNFHLSFTGHSLGGWLAQITTFTVEYLEMGEEYFFKSMDKSVSFHAHTVTFDSPGCEEMLIKLRRDYYLRYYNPLSLDQLDITSYLSAPNKINTCNHHVGTLYRLMTEYDLNFLEKHTALYNLSTHNMNDNFSPLFSSSGEVLDGRLFQIVDWPVSSIFHNGEYKEFFSHAKSSNNYHVEVDHKLIVSDSGNFYNGLRYQVKDFKPNACSLSIFTQEEIWLLECWHSLRQKGVSLEKIDDFCKRKKFIYEQEFLPLFELNLAEYCLLCSNRSDLKKTVRICKQLVKWCNEITNVLKSQLSDVPTSVEALLHAASANYLLSVKHNQLSFRDYRSRDESIESFFESDLKFVLNVVINQNCTDLEPLRIFNIIKDLKATDKKFCTRYLKDEHYVFLNWKYILGLYQVLDFEFIFQQYCNINLFVVDCSQYEVLADCMEKKLLETFLERIQKFSSCSQKKFIFITSDFYDKELTLDGSTSFSDMFMKVLSDKIFVKNKINNTTFKDLKQESQHYLLSNVRVKFQNEEWSLSKIMGLQNNFSDDNSNSEHVSALINPKILNTLVSGDMTIAINDKVPRLSDSEVAYLRFYKYYTEVEFLAFFKKNISSPDVLFFINCTKLDSQKKLIYEDHSRVKVNHVQNDSEENENFLKYCYQNQDQKIYCFKTDLICYCLERLYNAKFYIRRKFNNQFVLNFDVKLPKSAVIPDLFIFLNVNEEQKQCLIMLLSEKFHLIEDKNIIVTSQNDIKFTLEKTSQRSIHWFHVDEQQKCVWIKSIGALDNIRDIIKIDENNTCDEAKVDPRECKTLIIADKAGAGKSTTLTNLFSFVRNSWIIRINFKDSENVQNLKLPLTIEDVVDFLLPEQIGMKYDYFIRQLLKYLLLHKSIISVFILFDGFDEIRGDSAKESELLQSNIINLLIFLKHRSNASIWITTRDNRKEPLENNLSVFAIKFDMITLDEQRAFLNQFWRCRLDCEVNNDIVYHDAESRLQIYITELFSRAKEVFGKGIANFIGIPLQIRILGEIAMPNIQLFTLADGFQVHISNNILDLFGTYISNKYDIYMRQKTKLATGLNDVTRRWFSSILTNKHGNLAWKKIFFEEDFETHNCEELLELNAAGLIELNNSCSSFDFIDRNIAFYFIADRQVTLLKAKSKRFLYDKCSLEEHLLMVIFLQAEYRIIRLFMESHFAKLLSPIHEMEFYTLEIVRFLTDEGSLSKLCDNKNQTALHVLANEECLNILKFIFDGIQKCKDIASNKIIPVFTVRDVNHDTAFRIALRTKNWNLIMMFVNLIACYDPVIQEHLLVATLFVRQIDATSEEFKIVLEYSEKYPLLKNILIEVRNKCSLIQTIHHAVEKLNMEAVDDCFQKIGNETYKKYLLCSVDKEGRSPLLVAVKSNRKDLIDYLILLGSQLNVQDVFNMTLIGWAARNGNLNLIKYLIAQGCDYEKPDRNKISPMLHAAKMGHLNVVEYFLELHKNDKNYINYQDRFGNNALLWASKVNQLKVIKFLYNAGADIEAENRQGARALHVAVKSQNWNVMKYLVEIGANINIRNGFGNTPLHLTVKSGKWDMVHYLIKKGADINILDLKQRTAKEYIEEAGKSHVFENQLI